jgi:uncharacterized UPF0160 family protein
VINLFKKTKTLVTHNGGFHADDVFACAILEIYLESIGQSFEIIRTRDMALIEKGEYVFDVGGIYNENKNRFDHHQKGRAGMRDNGIYYAACGLVWYKFGEVVAGSFEVANYLDKKVFQALDAVDNGQNISKSIFPEVYPYSISSVVSSFNLSRSEDGLNEDKNFKKAVLLAKDIIKREIIQAKDYIDAQKDISKVYSESEDKRLIILSEPYNRSEILRILTAQKEPIYFIYPRSQNNGWKVECVRTDFDSFESRKPLPQSWAALSGQDFVKVSGVADATFCHDGRFLAQAKSLDGAITLAKKALNS